MDTLVSTAPQQRAEHEKLRKLIEQQCQHEKQAQQKLAFKHRTTECKEPSPSESLDPVRLILSHFGFMPSDLFVEGSQGMPSLISLDHKNPELRANLNTLDLISTRTSDTVFVYYIRKGRFDPQEILNSVTSKHYVNLNFLEFLNGLGLIIDVKDHAGWTGNVSSAWKVTEDSPSPTNEDYSEANEDHGGSAFDGIRKVLYWADVSHEMAFIVPSGRITEEDTFSLDAETVKLRPRFEGTDLDGKSLSSDEGTSVSSRTFSDSSRNSWRNKSKQLSLMTNVGCDTKILLFWLESYDDQNSLPIGKASIA